MHDLDRQQLEQYEQEGLLGEHGIGELTEAQEMELASQFLEITSEEELEEFLGNLLQRAKAAVGSAWNSPVAQQRVIPAVVTAAPVAADIIEKVLLPSGADVNAFQRTKALVERLKAAGDRVFKQELEGLSGEDREFEIARSYVRFAIDALQRALQTPPRVPQPVAAQVAVREAARRHAPGLVPYVPQLVSGAPAVPESNGGASSGRWVRRGASIVVDLG